MWLAACVLACTLLGSLGASAQSQRETERKLQQLRDELKTISADRRELEGKRGTAAQQLRQADEKVAKTARALNETEAAMRAQAQHLSTCRNARSCSVACKTSARSWRRCCALPIRWAATRR